jgi:ribonuclease T2
LNRGIRRGALEVVAALLIALLCMPQSAPARHRNRDAETLPGEFDYYLLSLSWSPAFCLSSPGAAECDGPRSYGFIVHGLWPQNEQGWPQYCNVHVPVPDEVVQAMADIMPSRQLVYHEWSAHGTCSGLDPSAFFALVRRAYASVTVPALFAEAREPLQRSPDSVADALLRANAGFAPQSVVVTCSGQSVPRLREVHICLDRDLKPRTCSADALREACRAPLLLVAPIR